MQTLKKIISRCMYRIAGILVLVLFILNLIFQLANEQKRAYEDANRTFLQMEQVLANNQTELMETKERYKQTCLHAAQTVARILEGEPETMNSIEELKQIAEQVEVDEIHFFDTSGKIFAGTEPKYYGYTMDSGEQIGFFKPMLSDKSLMLVQEITENTAEGKPMQYSAVWSESGEFIVQVGMKPANVVKVTEKNELSYIFSLFRVNAEANYYAIDRQSGTIVGATDVKTVGMDCSEAGFLREDLEKTQKGFYARVGGKYCFCVFVKIDSNYIGRVIPVRYLYRRVPDAVLSAFVCLLLTAFILTAAVTRIMNEYVVEKIRDVVQSLELIAQGNFERTVDIQDSVEFQKLSSHINRMKQSLLDSTNLEQQVNETLRTALQVSNPEESLDIMLECLGKMLKGERTYIIEKNDRHCDDNTYEWVAPGITPEKDNLQNLPPEICENWYHMFLTDKCVIFENIENIKDKNPPQYEILKSQHIVSIAVVPLYLDGSLIGFYGVDNPPKESLSYTTNMLQIMGYFIESLLKMRNLVRNLQHMSYSDQLTQFGNRHALWEYVKQTGADKSVGVVYCDITGLKKVNDEKGHEEGDRLIVSACECIKRALEGYGLFRIGGDELLAVCIGISEEELWERADKLKKTMSEYAVVLAVGAAWRSSNTEGISRIMAEAETLMYEDKAAYYAARGIDRRR